MPHRGVVDAMAAAAASAAAPQAIFTWAEAQQIPAKDKVSRRQAHAWLAELREQLQHHGQFVWDLSNSAKYNWRCYLAYHPSGRQIIGDGIFLFEVRTLGGWDANMQANRVDFVARRVDGTDVRLHHGSVKDTVPIYGHLADWLSEERTAPAPPALAVSGGLIHRDRMGYHGLASGGTISRAQIKQWLNERMEQWEASVLASSANPHLHLCFVNFSHTCVLVVAYIAAVRCPINKFDIP